MQRELGAGLMLWKGGIDAGGRSTEVARHQKPSGPQVITAEEGETGTVIALENPCTGLANAQLESRECSSLGTHEKLSFLSNYGMMVARRDMMATTTGSAGVVFPPRDLNALLDLGRFLEHHTEPGLLLGPDGEQVPLPEEVYRVLVEVVEAMREGKIITLVPRTQRLTTQEAADFLGVSRPTMVKLLEDGRIPYEQPGRHRRILFTDLLAYTEREHAGRRAALDRMTEDASDAGIYGGTPEDYAAALKRARRRAGREDDGS